MSQFEKLMGELGELATSQEQLAKALPADDGKDDEKIQAAAEEGGTGEGGGEGGDADAGKEGDDKPMAKSFTITLDDGTKVEAQDGAELVKALGERLDATEDNMVKALGGAMNLIKSQGDMIKSLGDQIKKLSGEGRGRRTVVSIAEKPAPQAEQMAKSLQVEGMTHDQFFAKAFEAQKAGRINGTDIAIAESSLNRGAAIPEHIVRRVTAA